MDVGVGGVDSGTVDPGGFPACGSNACGMKGGVLACLWSKIVTCALNARDSIFNILRPVITGIILHARQIGGLSVNFCFVLETVEKFPGPKFNNFPTTKKYRISAASPFAESTFGINRNDRNPFRNLSELPAKPVEKVRNSPISREKTPLLYV